MFYKQLKDNYLVYLCTDDYGEKLLKKCDYLQAEIKEVEKDLETWSDDGISRSPQDELRELREHEENLRKAFIEAAIEKLKKLFEVMPISPKPRSFHAVLLWFSTKVRGHSLRHTMVTNNEAEPMFREIFEELMDFLKETNHLHYWKQILTSTEGFSSVIWISAQHGESMFDIFAETFRETFLEWIRIPELEDFRFTYPKNAHMLGQIRNALIDNEKCEMKPLGEFNKLKKL